jgi:transposase
LLPRKNQSYSVNFKLKVCKAIEKDLMSLRDSSLKFNIPDTGIIVNGKDFANFGLAGLQPKPKADQNLWILINEKKTKIRQTTNKGRRTY